VVVCSGSWLEVRNGKEDRRCLDEDIRANLRWENNS